MGCIMNMSLGFVSCFSLLLNSLLLIRLFKTRILVEAVLLLFIFFTAQILVIGYILSFFNVINSIFYWIVLSIIVTLSIYIPLLRSPKSLLLLHKKNDEQFFTKKSFVEIYNDSSLFQKVIFFLLFLTLIIIHIVLILEILFTAPHTFDSITYHLARVAYYIQNGTVSAFGANYWAQEQLPKNSSVLLLYTYLVSGRNENITQVVQYISYWISVVSIYGICRNIHVNRVGSLCASLIFAILIEMIMEAVTTQNDMIITAYTGCIVYFLLRNDCKHNHYLYIGICTGIVMGVKTSFFLVIPSLFFITIIHFFQIGTIREVLNRLIILCCSILLFTCIFSLPAGYYENMKKYGHPLGEKKHRVTHSFEGKPVPFILKHGVKNLFRYSIDFLSLDGILHEAYPEIIKVNYILKNIPGFVLKKLNINLESQEGTRTRFIYNKPPVPHEDFSYWGILGFGLILPYLFLSIWGVTNTSKLGRCLSITFLIFFLIQSFSGPYDSYRGRYFITAGIFAVPLMGFLFMSINNKIIVKAYLATLIVIACLSAIFGVLYRNASQVIPDKNQFLYTDIQIDHQSEKIQIINKSIFAMDRLEQITRIGSAYHYTTAYIFEKIVPKNAVVGVSVDFGLFEYIFFGEKLTRTIIPFKNAKMIPVKTDYLLFHKDKMPVKENDIHIGNLLFLRKVRGI
jgi:hypothetical protein